MGIFRVFSCSAVADPIRDAVDAIQGLLGVEAGEEALGGGRVGCILLGRKGSEDAAVGFVRPALAGRDPENNPARAPAQGNRGTDRAA